MRRTTSSQLCRVRIATLALAGLASLGRPVFAQGSDTPSTEAVAEPTPAELQAQILELQKRILELEQQSLLELRRIRALLQQQARSGAQRAPAPPPVVQATVSSSASPALGSKDAPVTIVEFTDYECPFCARFYTTLLPRLEQEYMKAGKVRFVTRDLPLQMHKHAWPAAVAAHCAANQGKFWEMRDLLFRNQKELGEDALTAYALSLNLDMELFAACVEAEAPKALLDRDMADAAKAGIHATPTFVIGRTQANSTEITGTVIPGAQSYEVFAAAIDALLESDAPAPD